MAMIEQNMSGVKLERLRKKARRRIRIAKGIRYGVFGAGAILSLSFSLCDLMRFLPSMLSAGVLIGLIGMALGGVLISFLAALVLYLIALCILGKPSEEFARNYKNKYVLMKLREFPGFSQLRYDQNRGLSAQELYRACLPSGEYMPNIRSMDYWEGSYDCVRFQAAQLDFCAYDSHIMLFDGQVMIFSLFDEYKLSQTPVQVFAKRQGREKPKGLTFPEEIQTENEVFNQKFSVYAQDGQNAFYVLTPQVLEDILAFSEITNAGIYLVFSGQTLYVGCEQAENPFEPQEELPLEEQSGKILLAAEMVRRARDILVHLEHDKKRRGAGIHAPK